MNELIAIKGVRGFVDSKGIAQLNLEDISRGLGFVQVKDGKEYVRWERVHGHLTDMGFPQLVGKEYIPENVFYRLGMKGENESAIAFQNKVADEILPAIRKTGGYVGNDDLFINVYLPFADSNMKALFKTTLQTVRQQNELIQKQQTEIEYKEDVIVGLVDNISLAEKRQLLNRVVRHKNADFQERWAELYKQFEMKYHIDLGKRLTNYNKESKPKLKSKLDYIDKVMNKIPEMYEIACKLYESDIRELREELYALA